MSKYTEAKVVCGTTLSHILQHDCDVAYQNGYGPIEWERIEVEQCVQDYCDSIEGKDLPLQHALDVIEEYKNIMQAEEMACSEVLCEVLIQQGVEQQFAVNVVIELVHNEK